jgi:hypothetical protein
MKPRFAIALSLAVLGLATAGFAQRNRRSFESGEAPIALQPSYLDMDTEWAFGRLRYGGGFGRSSWATDYPKADRQFVTGVQRLTRLHARYIEEVVDPGTDDLFKWPWIYAVEVGRWSFTPAEAKNMRDYLLRGGFLMVDDFHGEAEWFYFMEGMRMIFPDRPIEDIPESDEINKVLFNIKDRLQIPNMQVIYGAPTYEREDGKVPHYRGIRDDKGRLIVVISHNIDIGDAWEWADEPRYPADFATQAYQIGINYIVYAMTH